MDLQAILDESDDDDEEEEEYLIAGTLRQRRRQRPSFSSSTPSIDDNDDASSSSSHINLERILREEDQEIITTTNISLGSTTTISTTTHHHHHYNHISKQHQQEQQQYDQTNNLIYPTTSTSTSMLGGRAGNYNNVSDGEGFVITNTASHNPEDWAVLQQILGEDEDETREDYNDNDHDDNDGITTTTTPSLWMMESSSSNNRKHNDDDIIMTSQQSFNVDAILDSIRSNDDEDDEEEEEKGMDLMEMINSTTANHPHPIMTTPILRTTPRKKGDMGVGNTNNNGLLVSSSSWDKHSIVPELASSQGEASEGTPVMTGANRLITTTTTSTTNTAADGNCSGGGGAAALSPTRHNDEYITTTDLSSNNSTSNRLGNGGGMAMMINGGSLLLHHATIQKQQQQQQQQQHQRLPYPSESEDGRLQTEKALHYASMYERRLLKPGHVDIISPLMVKRRLKPRLELKSRLQQQDKHQQPQRQRQQKENALAAATPGVMTSRFHFSGIMESKTMPGLSAKLLENSQEHLSQVGLPTALAVNSKFIAIGTQRGLILVFDLFEVLRQRLGRTNGEHYHSSDNAAWNASQGGGGGSVTTIDIAMNGESIVAGYTSGVIVLWDVIRGAVLKTVSDAHHPSSPITYVRYLSERDIKIVTVDAAGIVNTLHFTKNILWSAYSIETECLLDGTAGQILAINVLPPMSSINQLLSKDASPDFLSLFYLRQLVLIALSSERSSFAVAVEPAISVLHRWSRPLAERIVPPEIINTSSGGDEERKAYLPCLSWGWALVSGGGNVVTPILARAWGCCVQLLRASFPTLEGGGTEPNTGLTDTMHWPAFGVHDEFDVSAPVVALKWLGERSLVYLTVRNELLVADTVMMTLLERLDFSGLKLVYAEFSLSRSAAAAAAAGANDSEHDSSVETSSPPWTGSLCITFQNSVRTSDNRLLILCQEEVKSISILGVKRRIAALEQDGEWLEALALALDHYENTVKSQEDRKRDPDGKRDLSKHPEFSNPRRSEEEEWIAKLLIRYLNLAVENAPESTSLNDSNLTSTPERSAMSVPGRLDLAQSHFQMLAGVCIEFCVTTRRLDLLFGPVFRRFHTAGYLSVFLDVLEPYVLNDKLDYIAPEAMAYFVEHSKASNDLATVERCLLHMDVTIMDFDSILSLLRRNEMYSALFYVFTHGLDDFITPLEILLERVFDGADEGQVLTKRRPDGTPQNQFERFGYKAILYLKHCFNGETFPEKAALKPDDKLKSLRPQLLHFLQREQYMPSSTVRKPGQPSEVFGHRALRFPYSHVLLMVDARATLDAFSLAMDAPDADFVEQDTFESIGGWEVEVGEDATTLQSDASDPVRTPDRQKVISMLSSIVLPDHPTSVSENSSTLSKSAKAVDAFLDFMAKYLLRGIVRANKSVTFMILERMANRYVNASTPETLQAAQREIIELLTALPRNAYDPDEVLKLVESAGIHRAALTLHQQGASSWHEGVDDMDRRTHHFRSVIDCYLEDADPEFRKEVFAYAKKECSGDTCDNESKSTDSAHSSSLRVALCSKLPDLVSLDPVLSAQLVAEIYIEELDDVVSSLDSSDGGVSQFKFLHSIISGDLAKVDAVAGPVLNSHLTMDHRQVYLGLMAKLHPDMVYEYLSTHDNYRVEECLKLCQQYDIADASAYLLERMGNVSSALQLILQTLEGRMMNLKRTIRGMGVEFYRSNASRQFLSDWKKEEAKAAEQRQKRDTEVERVKRILVVALDLCERNSGSSASRSEHGSQLWFNVLDRLINAKGFLRLSKEQPAHAKVMAGVLSQLLQLTMQRMVSSVPLPDLVRKVTTDHSGSRLGELREMVESLLSTYGFELDVFSGAVNVMHEDIRSMKLEHRRLKVSQSRLMAFAPRCTTLAYFRICFAPIVGGSWCCEHNAQATWKNGKRQLRSATRSYT